MTEADGLRQRRPLRPQVVTDDNRTPEAKGGSSFSGRVFRATFLMLAAFLTIPLLGALVLLDSPIDPESLSFKEPPLFLGVLQPNTKLQQAERLFENQLVGPESIANIGDVMFTGTADGRVVKLENGEVETIARFGSGPCKTRDDEPACGRPLGIRAGPNGTLFVVDAYKGLFEVNPWEREVKLLLSSETPIEGRKMSFLNDLTVTRDGRKIYFTDSSSKWQRRDYLLLLMEGTDDGRGGQVPLQRPWPRAPAQQGSQMPHVTLCVGACSLLEYDTQTKEVKVLLDHLRFPNGVQLSPAEDFVLVAELAMVRIRRFYVSGLMKGGADVFVENLPGFPDNIRASSSGGYWVSMAAIRANPGFSMLDFLSERPYLKKVIFKLFSQETVMKFVPRYSLVLELSDSGAFRRSLHDPEGQVVTYVSEAHEHSGHLYLGSFRAPYLCRLRLQSA
ncbi:adipocyte plasma membrane-associated protein isoform 1-T1 [Dama dama]|uniref:adipocyte plasma membrane-associated protein isoform X1 n=1 Tax=Dama dama TaxID=30532 RepID=UPI002A3589D0|nr:adipocyte plasma membrane-associated protein isoform X1 [Dama dama]